MYDDYNHQMWKMIHLLYGDRDGELTIEQLESAGVNCRNDSRERLEKAGVVKRIGDRYELSEPAQEMLRTFTIALGPTNNVKIRVDYPEIFVVMPFGEPWSDDVFTKLFKPGIEGATFGIEGAEKRFTVSPGDSIVRVGDLSLTNPLISRTA